MLLFVFEILGLQKEEKSQSNKEIEFLELLIELRKNAKENKDFATADSIRNKLTELGVTLKDSKEGTSFTIN